MDADDDMMRKNGGTRPISILKIIHLLGLNKLIIRNLNNNNNKPYVLINVSIYTQVIIHTNWFGDPVSIADCRMFVFLFFTKTNKSKWEFRWWWEMMLENVVTIQNAWHAHQPKSVIDFPMSHPRSITPPYMHYGQKCPTFCHYLFV